MSEVKTAMLLLATLQGERIFIQKTALSMIEHMRGTDDKLREILAKKNGPIHSDESAKENSTRDFIRPIGEAYRISNASETQEENNSPARTEYIQDNDQDETDSISTRTITAKKEYYKNLNQQQGYKRTVYKMSSEERDRLYATFEENQKPTAEEYNKLQDDLQMPKSRIKRWFANQRRKAKIAVATSPKEQ